MPEDATPASPGTDLLKRLPRDVAASFTAEQRAALDRAIAPSRHGVDIRLSLPFLGERRYVVLLAGREKRPRARLDAYRRSHALWTLSNIALFAVLSSLLALALVQAVMALSVLVMG